MNPTIMIVDDEESVRDFLQEVMEDAGYTVITAPDGGTAFKIMETTIPATVLLDIRMPEIDGLKVLNRLRKKQLQTPVILMTAFGTTDLAIQAMKEGAFDYIIKPFNLDELLLTVKKAVEMNRLADEVVTLRGELGQSSLSMDALIGDSPAMREVYKNIGRVTNSKITVLIQGESGTGKELVARAIHYNSERRNGPFVKINCAAIPENLIESELFGHEKGAFTGANFKKPGKFELAHNGTIFLDEVGELSLPTQAKLLRVLQEREFERVGGTKNVVVDVRILAATNKDLEKCVQEGTFREDLFFRLNVVKIWLPPLRDRNEDIPGLVNYFLQNACKESGRSVSGITPEAMQLIVSYDWPGNVRELRNVCEQAVVMARGPVIVPENLPFFLQESNKEISDMVMPGRTLKEIVTEVEKQVILKALRENNWNRTQTAQALGLNRRSLYAKMKEYGLID